MNLPIEHIMQSEGSAMMLLGAKQEVVLSANSTAARLFGVSVSELQGCPVRQLSPDTSIWARLFELPSHEEHERLTTLVDTIHIQGRIISIEVHPSWFEQDGDLYVFLLLHDVTDRLIMEDALDEERSKWQSLLEHSSDLTILIDQDFSVLYVSPFAAQSLGEDVMHLMNQPLFKFMHLDDAALFRRHIERIRDKDDATTSLDCRLYHSEEDWFWVTLTVANKLATPSLHGFVINGRDIHEQQLILRETQRYGRLLEISQELSNMGSWEWNIHTNDIYWSDQVYAIYGMTPEDSGHVNYELYQSHIHPDDRAIVREIIEQAVARREPFEHYHRTIDDQGEEVSFVYGYGVPEFDEYGDVHRYIGISNDVTQMRHMELQLKAFNQSLQLNRQALEQFVSVASHDLKEPARKIKTFSELLVRKYAEDMPEGAARHIQRIHSAALRMEALIEALLRYSQVSGSEIVHQSVDLNRILEEVIEDLELRIQEKDARIDVPTLPTIEGDPTRLRQLFQNLIANALKFTSNERDSRIQVRTRFLCNLDDEDQHDPPLEHGSHVEILVQDNGVGFDASMAEKIFDPFTRAHGRSAFQGTGIGLAICQTIAKQHLGKLEAQSPGDSGATFKIILPCRIVIDSDNFPINSETRTWNRTRKPTRELP